MNDALRQLLRGYRPDPPLPTTLDFYRELQAVTPDSLHYLLNDLFATNTFWELKTAQATAKQTNTGTWQVTLDVEARKVTVDSMGREANVPMSDWVEIGVFAPAEKGRQTSRPIQARIDPNHLLIDYKMNDNMKTVEIPNKLLPVHYQSVILFKLLAQIRVHPD